MNDEFEKWYNEIGVDYFDLGFSGLMRMVFKAGWDARGELN